MNPKGAGTRMRRLCSPPLPSSPPAFGAWTCPKGSGTNDTHQGWNFKRTGRKAKQETEAFRRLRSSAAFLLSTYYVPGIFTDNGGQSIVSELRLHIESSPGAHVGLCRADRMNHFCFLFVFDTAQALFVAKE